MASLTLQLLTHRQTETLPALLTSLVGQSDRNWKLLWLDNGPTSAERQKMKEYRRSAEKDLSIVSFASETNIGFSGGHQFLYEKDDSDYVMLINDDAILEPDYVVQLRNYLDNHERTAAATGAILRYEIDGNGTIFKTAIIDSLGLVKNRAHRVSDIGSGQLITNYQLPITIFGVSGCLPIYRRKVIGPRLFDPSYFLYKEDVDLAYRLRRAGYKAVLIPTAVAYHRRSFRSSSSRSDLPWSIQWFSYRNHWRNLRRHLDFKDWLRDGWAILPFEAVKAIYMIYKRLIG